ncbi:MAG: siderophore-interacting protein, partial [Tritonibacter mobilis]|nr:siderophore-interacting protein [Tritonibacter mobilis]
MSIQGQFPFAAHTLLPNISYPTLRNAIQHRAKEFNLPLVHDSETEIQLKTAYGTYRFWQGDEAPIAEIGSSRSDWLYVLKESLQDIIHE